MKIAFVSDIHGNLPALEAVIQDIRRQGVDQVVCLGDNLSGPLLPKQTAQLLMDSGWVTLAGNHERGILEVPAGNTAASDVFAYHALGSKELEWVKGLKPWLTLNDQVYLCHGTPLHDETHLVAMPANGILITASLSHLQHHLQHIDQAVVACGHSHLPRVMRRPNGQLIFNPGSVGLQAYIDPEPIRYVVELGTPDAHYGILTLTSSGWHAAIHTVPYDFASMAKLAEQNGRPDWVVALKTGYVQ
jgi:putative phosphoesterase